MFTYIATNFDIKPDFRICQNYCQNISDSCRTADKDHQDINQLIFDNRNTVKL